MLRVRMFGDWDNDSRQLIDRLRHQTTGFDGDNYKNLTFVDDESYTHAIVFDYPVEEISSPPLRNVLLMLEPPEISEWMHGGARYREHPQIGQFYSFCVDDIYPAAPGLGFATVPMQTYPDIHSKTKNVCMMVSDKQMTPYHTRRHLIKDALLQTDLDIDFYGRNLVGNDPRIKGTIPNMGKYEVISQYRYCIDFENSMHSAITDKYFDPILTNTVPITNVAKVNELAPNSAVVVDFNWHVSDIVEAIRIAVDQEPTQDIGNAKKEILEGKMCLAKWIHQKVNEL